MAKKVQAGQRNPLNKASVINDVLAATAAYKSQALGSARPGQRSQLATDIVQVRNNHDSAFLRGHCVQISDYALGDIDRRHLWLEGDLPADPPEPRIVIMHDPCPPGEIHAAHASGVCVAVVNVQDVEHGFAVPVTDSGVLNSEESGPIELLTVPGSTGEQELVVRFFGGTGSETGFDRCMATVVSDFDESNTTFSVDGAIATRGSQPSSTLTVQNTFQWEGHSGFVVFIEYHQGTGDWHAYQMNCVEED